MAKLAVIVGLDIGTTHLKVLGVRPDGERVRSIHAPIVTQLDEGRAEQDPQAIRRMVLDAVDDLRVHYDVKGLAISTAMHAFMVLDKLRRPATTVWTWMDRRAETTAQRIRQTGLSSSLQAETGTPVHAMSPLVKWIHWRTQHAEAIGTPVALKDYLIEALTGELVTDMSTASATGFLGIEGRWNATALELARLSPKQLPPVVAMDAVVAHGSRAMVAGGTDGPLAHLGLNINPGDPHAVLSLGTSGAIRVSAASPPKSLPPSLFCYVTGREWLLGSAFSNMGNLLAWLSRLTSLPVPRIIEQGLAVIRDRSELPLLIPYLHGERSPWWDETLSGQILGLKSDHGAQHLAGAALYAMAASFLDGLEVLERVYGPIRTITAGSRLFQAPGLAQWFADSLQRPILQRNIDDASVWGALALANAQAQWEPQWLSDGDDQWWYPRSSAEHDKVAATLSATHLAVKNLSRT